MKNIFTNIDQVNPIATLFKELYFPLKSKTISESSPPIPTTIAKFFEIIAYHFDLVYKERLLILNSSFPSNSIDITDYMKTLIIEPNDPSSHDYSDLTDPINISNAIHSRFVADLEKFAKERGLYQLKNESDPQFQSRIINAHRFLLTSPTLSGLTDIITSVISDTPKKFIIRELHKESWILGDNNSDKDTSLKTNLGLNTILGNNISSYYFVVDFKDNEISSVQKAYLENVINLYKPAHAGFHINAFLTGETSDNVDEKEPKVNTYLDK